MILSLDESERLNSDLVNENFGRSFKIRISYLIVITFATINFVIQFYKGPTSGIAVTLKTGRREVPGSNLGRICRPSRLEFSVVFSETRVNTG